MIGLPSCQFTDNELCIIERCRNETQVSPRKAFPTFDNDLK